MYSYALPLSGGYAVCWRGGSAPPQKDNLLFLFRRNGRASLFACTGRGKVSVTVFNHVVHQTHVTGLHDGTVDEDVHHVRLNVLENFSVMGDDQESHIGRTDIVNALEDNARSVNIKS